MNHILSKPLLDAPELDATIDEARAKLAALLRGPAGSPAVSGAGHLAMVAEGRAVLAGLLELRLARTVARLDERDSAERDAASPYAASYSAEPSLIEQGMGEQGPAWQAAAVASVRADRDEAIAVTGALLYELAPDDPAWPEVALRVGRLSYDRYSDPWPAAAPVDPADLDAACDLMLRAVRGQEADERTARYLVLALRDRQRLLGCPTDTLALLTWGKRLLAFPNAGGLGRDLLTSLLEAEARQFARPDALRPSADPLEPAHRDPALAGQAAAGPWTPRGLPEPRLVFSAA